MNVFERLRTDTETKQLAHRQEAILNYIIVSSIRKYVLGDGPTMPGAPRTIVNRMGLSCDRGAKSFRPNPCATKRQQIHPINRYSILQTFGLSLNSRMSKENARLSSPKLSRASAVLK